MSGRNQFDYEIEFHIDRSDLDNTEQDAKAVE